MWATDVRLIVSAIASKPKKVRLPGHRFELSKNGIESLCEVVFKQTKPLSNINADIEWRREMVKHLTRRCRAILNAGLRIKIRKLSAGRILRGPTNRAVLEILRASKLDSLLQVRFWDRDPTRHQPLRRPLVDRLKCHALNHR